MSRTIAPAPAEELRAPRPHGPDTRTVSRILAAVIMPLGPASIAVGRLFIPEGAAQTAAAQDLQPLSAALGIIAVFTLVPGAYAAVRLVSGYRPVFAIVVAALLVPGYLGGSILMAIDSATLAGLSIGMPIETIDALTEAIFALPTVLVLSLTFVVGHVAGTVVLGVAVCAARLAPLAVGILLTVSQPLHVFALVTTNRPLDMAAWGLTAVGYGYLAWRVLRTPNDEWELRPGHRGPRRTVRRSR